MLYFRFMPLVVTVAAGSILSLGIMTLIIREYLKISARRKELIMSVAPDGYVIRLRGTLIIILYGITTIAWLLAGIVFVISLQ